MIDDQDLEDVRPDPALDAWLGDVTAAVEDGLQRSSVPWDFAAMLARAHALDADLVSLQAVREAEQAEPVISLAQRRTQRATREDPEFVRLVEDVRVATEHDAALRSNGVTPMAPRRQGGLGRIAIAAVALAAAVVLGFGVIEGVQMLRTDESPADAALHQGDASGATPEQAVIDEGTRERAPAVTPPMTVEIPAPADAATPTASEPRVLGKPRKPKTVAAEPPQPSLAERLAALDGEAHAAWKAGDFATAETKFEALIALAGETRLADLAYGDLFTLARRRGDAEREVGLWKRYLAAFASGRFADDARAGLCRKAAALPAACWREYLADFPEGSFRSQAEREGGGAK